MSSFFRPKTTIVSVPSSSQSSGSAEAKPYAPTIPFLDRILPQIESEFDATPDLFRGSLIPQDSAQTLAARQNYQDLSTSVFPALGSGLSGLFANRLSTALGDPTQDRIFQEQTGNISNLARQFTERDKQTAQEQAINAGQFGLGSTATAEFEELQRRQREETTQQQLAAALQQAEARRVAAASEIPGLASSVGSLALTPASLQEAIGKDVEQREQARLQDQARIQQQEQEARRLQLITKSNLLSGLAGLGTQTAYQGKTSGVSGQAFASPSIFQQLGSFAGNIGQAAAGRPG